MLRKLVLLFTFVLCNGYKLSGNTYTSNFKIPLLYKQQNIELKFVSDKMAVLNFSGFIRKNCIINYTYNDINESFDYSPDHNIKEIMNKYLLTLNNIVYNKTIDKAYVTIRSKLFRNKHTIEFKNIICN